MRRSLITVIAGLAALFGSTLTVSAAPAPSATFVMVCSRAVTYTDIYDAPSAQVVLFDANGAPVGSSAYISCPDGGGRIRTSIPATAKPASAMVRCWNGFIQAGDFSGPLTFKVDCVDRTGSYGTFAAVTVR